jgi:hypothetical protein
MSVRALLVPYPIETDQRGKVGKGESKEVSARCVNAGLEAAQHERQ